jgi:hypothetical protein
VRQAVAGQVYGMGEATPPNKEMKLTSVERIGRSQLDSSVRRTSCERDTIGDARDGVREVQPPVWATRGAAEEVAVRSRNC